MVYSRKSLDSFRFSSLRQHPYILGYYAETIPHSEITVSIDGRAIVQLSTAQQVTANKTFPVVRDQYTIERPPRPFAIRAFPTLSRSATRRFDIQATIADCLPTV
jgi:hypothetical protein